MGDCLHSLQCDDCSKARRKRHPAPKEAVEALIAAVEAYVTLDRPFARESVVAALARVKAATP
ncbi:MAG: hypothetical protein NXI30_04585 [bacterium]|nr:hypothetical protein [bacterium]